MNQLPANSIFTIVREYDAENYQQVVGFLDYAALLPDDLAKLYEIHRQAITPHLTTSPARVAAGLYVLCLKHLVLGVTSLFRLYSAPAWRETRAAVEAAGIAHAIQTAPAHFKVFSEDDGSERARRLARNTFKSDVIFPQDVPVLRALKVFYDVASQLSHTNSITFIQHINSTGTAGQQQFAFQDIPREAMASRLPKLVFWTCQAHLAILTAADQVFSGLPADLDAFKKERAYIFGKLSRFNEKHNSSLAVPLEPG
jgi:hypothetical protein